MGWAGLAQHCLNQSVVIPTEIANSCFHPCSVVVEMTDASVAATAKQPSYVSAFMAVIDMSIF